MLRTLIAIAVAAVSLSSANARADWYMVGPEEFRPVTPGVTGYGITTYGFQLNASGQALATIRLPVSSTVTSLFCQVYDSSNQNLNVSLIERYSDDNGFLGTRLLGRIFSDGYSGHQKIYTTTFEGSSLIKYWDSSATGGGNRYFTYYLYVFLPGGGSYTIKSCAIGYNPP